MVRHGIVYRAGAPGKRGGISAVHEENKNEGLR